MYRNTNWILPFTTTITVDLCAFVYYALFIFNTDYATEIAKNVGASIFISQMLIAHCPNSTTAMMSAALFAMVPSVF